MANLPLAFAELLAGAVILDAAIKGDTIANVVSGQATQHPLTGSSSSTGGGASTGSSGAVNSGPVFSKGASSSRLDQGQDVTSTQFNTPVAGKVILADQSNSGWAGGGMVTILLDTPIRLADGTIMKALYFAEGISPTVSVGQHVNANDQVGIPVSNPYNGIKGNIEWGPANPNSPSQPLAQVIGGAAGMVRAWYKWALSVGAPSAAATGNAGSA